MNRSQFTQAFLTRAQKRYPSYSFEVISELVVKVRQDPELPSILEVLLESAFFRYEQDPTALNSILENRIVLIEETFEKSGTVDAARILPTLKSLSFMESVRGQAGRFKQKSDENSWPIVAEELLEGVFICYAFDDENGLRFLTAADPAKLGMTISEIRAQALTNLNAHVAKTGIKIHELSNTAPDRIFLPELDGVYESSLLLMPQTHALLKTRVRGDVVAYCATRNIVVITGTEEHRGVAIAGELARSAFADQPYAILDWPMVLRNGVWQRFMPPGAH